MKTLEQIQSSCWSLLFRGAVQNRDEFHTPVLATYNGTVPNARTVVLRETIIEHRTLLFYSDIRSTKIKELETCPFATLVFWNPGKHVQIRAKGEVTIHHKDEVAIAAWAKLPAKNRKDYATTTPPSSVAVSAENHLPEFWSQENLSVETTNPFFVNFVVLAMVVTELDWLLLEREGHKRALFTWEDSQWHSSWLVP